MNKEELLKRLVEIYNNTETQSELAEEIATFLQREVKEDIAEVGLKLRDEW